MIDESMGRALRYSIVCVLFGAVAAYIMEATAPPRELWVSFLVFVLAGIAVGFLIGAVIAWADYIAGRSIQHLWMVRRAMAVTPTVELARTIATLRPDQTILMPEARYSAEVGAAAGMNGPEHFLLTPFMNIPLEWLWDYLNERCTRIELYPVRRYASESMEQRYAQAFTAWATQPHLHLAIPANGPEPAKWVMSENGMSARDRCIEMIWGVEEK
jgi:hypothetical protein